jgi:hypothetical protein
MTAKEFEVLGTQFSDDVQIPKRVILVHSLDP